MTLRRPPSSTGEDSPDYNSGVPCIPWRQLATILLECPFPQKFCMASSSSGWWRSWVQWTSFWVSWPHCSSVKSLLLNVTMAISALLSQGGILALLVSNALSRAFSYTCLNTYMPGTSSCWFYQHTLPLFFKFILTLGMLSLTLSSGEIIQVI